jgi:hypothetical protein
MITIALNEFKPNVIPKEVGNYRYFDSLHKTNKRWILKLDFIDSSPNVLPRGINKQEATISYFKGLQVNWKKGIPTFSKVIYENLWSGIDLVYSGSIDHLKYEFIVQPGTNPNFIQARYRGATDISITDKGKLKIITPSGEFTDDIPYAYQWEDDKQIEVPISYKIIKEVYDHSFIYSFDIGDYDTEKPLMIDPALLVYCGFIGGKEGDYGLGIDVDGQGNAYIVGHTQSTESSFPIKSGPDLTFNNSYDAFVAKISKEGKNLEYCGYIGGYHGDWGEGISVDDRGNAYITGMTGSGESSFPVKSGPGLFYKSGYEAFVAKVNPQGTDLVYCGYIGGDSSEGGHRISVDNKGNAYVIGYTESSESTFPVKIGPDLTHNGKADTFIAKVKADGTDLEYCGYVGGIENDDGWGISVDSKGNAYISGYTDSSESSFPVKIGPDLTYNENGDAFVAKVNANGSSLVYCGYLGGDNKDNCYDLDIDSQGCTYLTGYTDSPEQSFPIKAGPDLTYNGDGEAYVAKLSQDGKVLEYCGYIGGEEYDSGLGITVDIHDNAYIVGSTRSPETSFPVINGPSLCYKGGLDTFIAKVDHEGTSLDYCGYISGNLDDSVSDVAVDHWGNAYIVGYTYSDESSFPVVTGPFLTKNELRDAFVAKVVMTLAINNNLISSQGGTIDFVLNAGLENGSRTYLIVGGLSGTEPGYPLPGGLSTLPINYDRFTHHILLPMINTSYFTDFMGVLGESGNATAQLNVPPVHGFSGHSMYYAFCLNDPFDFVSNPVEIKIVE